MKSASQYEVHPILCKKQNNKYATICQVQIYPNHCSSEGVQTLPIFPSDRSNMKMSIEHWCYDDQEKPK